MALLAIAVVTFSLIHLIPAVPPLKARLEERIGPSYGPLFGTAATLSLILIVVGWRFSGYVHVYDPPAWGRYISFVLTFIAFLGLGIFLFRGRLRQILRFPLAMAVMLWAAGHLFANGDLASLILFGGLFIYAAAHLALGLANGVRPSSEVRGGHDGLAILAGVALYAVMAQLHPVLIGVPVLPLPGR